MARRDSISIGGIMINQAKYGMLAFLPDDIMIASRVGVIFLAEIVETIIGWAKYFQTDFHETDGKKEG